MNCPRCNETVTLQHIRDNPECDKHIASLCGLRSLSKRGTVTHAGGRPYEPWDGITNPQSIDLADPKELRRYSQMKRCRSCKGPLLNRLKVRTCPKCRESGK